MRKIILSILLTSLAGQAAALSCMRPDPIALFNEIAEQETPYFVLWGTLDFDETLLPESFDNDRIGDTAPIPAQFSGLGLTGGGFVGPYDVPAQLQIQCFGPWCGGAADGMEAIFFVPASDSTITIYADPCGGRVFPDPAQDVLIMLESCMSGGTCESVGED